MENYKSNSNKMKESKLVPPPEKKLEKVVKNKVHLKKKSEFRKFFDQFISEDAGSVSSVISNEILIPSIKKAITDIITNAVDIIFWGERRHNKSGQFGVPGRISYSSFYNRDPIGIGERRSTSPQEKTIGEFNDIVIESRGDAQEVLDKMEELISTYGIVSVADYYDILGMQSNYTSNNYGWNNLAEARIVRVYGGGYTIKMPRAMPIK